MDIRRPLERSSLALSLGAMEGMDGGGWVAAGEPELGASAVGDGRHGRRGMAAGEPVLGASAGHPNLWELYLHKIAKVRDGPRWAHVHQAQPDTRQ